MTPYKMQNLVYEWVDFSKFGQIWAKIGSKLRKFWKKLVILFKIWPKIGPIEYPQKSLKLLKVKWYQIDLCFL